MAINFPTSLDNFTNPTSGNTLDSPSHSVQHSDINDAVEAIEAKIGVGSSTAGSATAGYALVNTSGGTTAYSLLGVSGLTSGTATNGQVLTANGSGAVSFETASSGGVVVQIVFATTTTDTTVSNNTFVDTTLTGTITPTSASNKVLVMVTHGSNQKDLNNTGMAMRLMRDATEIAGIIGDGGKTGTSARSNFGGTSLNYLDTPATTSAVTYKTQFMSQGNNANVSVQSESRMSSITLIEVTP
jgi:hypothetical protein